MQFCSDLHAYFSRLTITIWKLYMSDSDFSFDRSHWRSYSWSNINGCFWDRNLGPWWSVGWKVCDYVLLFRCYVVTQCEILILISRAAVSACFYARLSCLLSLVIWCFSDKWWWLEVHWLSADNRYRPIIGQFSDNRYRPFESRHRPIDADNRLIICFNKQNNKKCF